MHVLRIVKVLFVALVAFVFVDDCLSQPKFKQVQGDFTELHPIRSDATFGACSDRNIHCKQWADYGKCSNARKKDWMGYNCCASCRAQRPCKKNLARLCWKMATLSTCRWGKYRDLLKKKCCKRCQHFLSNLGKWGNQRRRKMEETLFQHKRKVVVGGGGVYLRKGFSVIHRFFMRILFIRITRLKIDQKLRKS